MTDSEAEVEQRAAHSVALAEAMEPAMMEYLDESPGFETADFDEVPALVAHVAGKLAAQGFGKL